MFSAKIACRRGEYTLYCLGYALINTSKLHHVSHSTSKDSTSLSSSVAICSRKVLYRHLLQELAADLTSDEVSEMVFLLRFHIKGKKARSEIKSEATKLLTELEKLDCIGVDNLTLLVELFELIGRTDLRNRIAEKLGHSFQLSEHQINEFMRILWNFGQKLDSEDLKNAKFILDWTRDKDIENVWQMFEKAFERGLLDENNMYSIGNLAEHIKQIERLKLVKNWDSFMYAGSNYTLGITSTSGMSQEEYLCTKVGITPRKEERLSWRPEQPRPEKHLPHYSPYVGINPKQSESNNQYIQQISVPHVDDMSIPLEKTDPYGLINEPVEKFQRQDASARQKDAGHETHLRDINEQIASLKLFEPQNTLDAIREEKICQNEVKDVREMGVTGSSSDNVNFTSKQAAPTGIQFKGEIDRSNLNTNEDQGSEQASARDKQKEASKDVQTGGQSAKTETRKLRGTLQDVINVEEPKSEQASERDEQKKASLEIKSRDEKHMYELNIYGSHPDFLVEENKSIQNEAMYVRDMANSGIFGATSHVVINNQNEASPNIKMNIIENLKDIGEMPKSSQSPSGQNLTLGQTIQTETGNFNGPVDAPTHFFSLDLRSKGASQIADQKGASQEIISSSLIEEKISKLNLSKESNASSNETRKINDLINSEQVDITYGQDAQNEERMPGNINQSYNDAAVESKQDSVEQTSISDENHVGTGREGPSSVGTSLFSSGHARTSESEGGDANGKQEAIDGKSTNSRNQEQSERLLESGVSQTKKTNYDTFSTTGHLEVCFTKHPRRGRILVLTVEGMESYIGEKIGDGAFGDVYKAKISDSNLQFAIKEIRVKKQNKWKTYEKEIHSGRILHPFINPIIARAEKPPSETEEGVAYLMYPYMQHKDLRKNIDLENGGHRLSEESNSCIWTRCIFQIAQAVDYLHKPVKSIRGQVFHRDLSSQNIFLDQDFNAKIGDFGGALEAKVNAKHATVTSTMGTRGYHPPNMNRYKYEASYDTFSIGVVILEILTGEKAELDNEDFDYLHEKYRKKGYNYLIDQLDQRAENVENEAAKWPDEERRNKFAEIALSIVSLAETQMNMDKLLQELDDMRLDSDFRYQKPASRDRCVSCYVNPPAKLSLKGVDCMSSQNRCQYFCHYCLMINDVNPLVCPHHGKTRPPFGDHVYGVFVAGNHVKGISNGDEPSKIAQIFIRDVEKVVDVLTAKHPFVLGASAERLKVVKPNNPGTEDEMAIRVENAFKEIAQKLETEKREAGGRLPDSLFIFYFSGHCTKENGLYLGKEDETLKASTEWIKEMLHEKLHVDQVLVILDCCHAASQDFNDSQGLNSSTCSTNGEKDRIHQLYSCDTDQNLFLPRVGQDQGCGSRFTDILCKGLQGMDSRRVGENSIFCCEKREKQRGDKENMDLNLPCVKYHLSCASDHVVTLTALNEYIHSHCDQTCALQRKKKLFLTYYNQDKMHISIHLKGSKIPDGFWFSYLAENIDKLKEDIIIHTVKQKVDCDVLLFHQSYTQTSSRLVAIYPKYGRDKDEELTTMDCIYRAWRSNCELEARVRETLKGLSNGPIRISTIKRSMITLHDASFNEDYLKISQTDLMMTIEYKSAAENKIKEIRKKQPTQHEKFKKFLQEILNVTQDIPSSVLENKQDKLYLYALPKWRDFSSIRNKLMLLRQHLEQMNVTQTISALQKIERILKPIWNLPRKYKMFLSIQEAEIYT